MAKSEELSALLLIGEFTINEKRKASILPYITLACPPPLYTLVPSQLNSITLTQLETPDFMILSLLEIFIS